MARRPQDETIDALFAELHATGSSAARQALIERYLPLARSLAARYSYTPQPLDDLVQVASLGLVKAVPTIIGELKRHMRDSAWAVHVPRALKEKAVLVERAERTLAARSGASPTVDELAAEADLGVEEVLDALSVRLAQDAVPLDTEAVPGANADLDGGGASSDRDLGAVDDSLALASAFRRLRPRERTILRLRIVDGLTQTEIAAAVGLSQMYVSRLLRATLESLRSEIDLDR
jgi:RNA polymerase sigma-B factor